MTSLSLNILSKRFGDHLVFSDVRLSLPPGRIVTLVGASGCGKSTLLRIAARMDRKFAGWVRLGQDERGQPGDVAVVFPEPRLFPWLTIAQNVSFAPGAQKADARALALLEEVGLAGRAHALPRQLTGGQALLAAIARALYNPPKVLLLDEPFHAADAVTRRTLRDLLATIAQRHGITLLLATRDIDEALLVSDRVVVLSREARGIAGELGVTLPRPRDPREPNLRLLRGQVLDTLDAAQAA